MIFAKELILKGVAGLAVVGGLGAGGIYVWNQRKGESLETLIKKVGLKDCTADSNNVCNIDDGGVSVKHSDSVKGKKTKSSTGSTGKIKVYTVDKSGYNEGFKFVIEEGDISLNNGGTPSKLEQFETYEIKKEETGNDWYLTRKTESKNGIKKEETGNDWYLTRKTESKNGIKKALGLEDCDFPTSGQDGCDIAGDKFKKVKFDGITESVVSGHDEAKLKISTESNTTEFPLGYKFTLVANKDVKISDSLTIKANTNTEFKIKKKNSDSNEITLEKVWDIDKLAKKLDMTCTTGSDSSKECTLVDGKINVFEEDNKKVVEANVKTSSQSNNKLKVQEGVENHNQGFKFYLDGSSDIELCKDSETSPSVTKIEKQETATYEIIEKTEGNSTKWYLSKKGVVS